MPRRVELLPTQTKFIQSTARYIGFISGIGAGKTAIGSIKAIQKIGQGEDGIIVAPDFPQLSKSTWPEFMKWAPMSRCTNRHLDHPFTNKKMIQFDIHGKTVTVYYGGIENEGGWAGPNVNWAWFDEGGRKRTRRAFDVLAARIRVGKNPQLWVTTTPAGVTHWLYDVFVKGVISEEAEKAIRKMGWKGKIVEYFTASTEENAKNLDPFHYAMLTGMYSGKLKEQELGGVFVSMEGAVWELFEAREGGRNCTEDADYHHGVPVEWWVDDGFTKGHPRVILYAQIIPPYINVFDEYVVTRELAEESIKRALEKPWAKPSVSYVDSSAAEFRSRLWLQNIDTVSATHDVDEGIKRTASWICDGQMRGHFRFHPRCEYSLKEVPGYVRHADTQKPLKESDNVADAMRYGLWTKPREDIWDELYEVHVPLRLDIRMPDADSPTAGMRGVPMTTESARQWYLSRWHNGLNPGRRR